MQYSIDKIVENAFASEKNQKQLVKMVNADKSILKNHSGDMKRKAEEYGREMKEILRNEVRDIVSERSGKSFLDYIDFDVENKNNSWIVNVSFNEYQTHRDSLWKEGYPSGVQLVDIYNNGMDARGSVYGEWYGNSIESNPHRDALHFIQNAVAKFNITHKNVKAVYDEKYD